MGWVFERPSLTAIEVGWHLLFGLPFLVVCWIEAQRILVVLPLDSAGLTEIDPQNPWVAVVQISRCVGALSAARDGRAALASAGGERWPGW